MKLMVLDFHMKLKVLMKLMVWSILGSHLYVAAGSLIYIQSSVRGERERSGGGGGGGGGRGGGGGHGEHLITVSRVIFTLLLSIPRLRMRYNINRRKLIKTFTPKLVSRKHTGKSCSSYRKCLV